MPILKPLFVGEIKLNKKETLFSSHKGTRQSCTSDLNSWLFDFTHSSGRQVVQLPPLDDWSRSEDDVSLWFYEFHDLKLLVTVKTETVEYP